jgi:hypothetical protein
LINAYFSAVAKLLLTEIRAPFLLIFATNIAMMFSATVCAGLMDVLAAQAMIPDLNQVVESECGAAKETSSRAGGMSIVQICQAV